MLLFIILALATYYTTRFFTVGTFPLVAGPREKFIQRWGVYVNAKDPLVSMGGQRTNPFMRALAKLAECDWCQGAWWAALFTWLADLQGSVDMPGFYWLALAAVTGFLRSVEPENT